MSAMSKATIFPHGTNITDPHYLSIDQMLIRIRDGGTDGKTKDKVLRIRELKKAGKDTSKEKLKLPSVIFAGECTKEIECTYKSGPNIGKKYMSKRKDESLTKHSGFFVLDFDHVDVNAKKQQLKNDEYIYACWESPSGDGVKALVSCPPSIKGHEDYYTSFLRRYPELDSTSRNIARLCFESYDPDLFKRANSKKWDKKLPKETPEVKQVSIKEKHSDRIMAIAVSMIRDSVDGEKHDVLLKAAKLCGGYIASNLLDEDYAKGILLDEVKLKSPKNLGGAEKDIADGIAFGKSQPLHEIKKIEKAQKFVKREDGTYDFLADVSEMDEYEASFIAGTLPMGLPTGLPHLDTYWMYKENTLCWFGGLDNVGKSFVLWYLAVLQAMINGKKFLLFSAENSDGMVRKKLKEFFLGESVKDVPPEFNKIAGDFIDKHFKLMTSKKMHTWEEFIIRAEIVYDEGWYYDCLIAEPYNSMDIPNELSAHMHTIKTLNALRVFKENYTSVWVADHAGTQAARDVDDKGNVKVPWKSSIDGGVMKANKVDDFIVIHRLIKDPDDWNKTEIHTQKIKDVESGGSISKSNPFRMMMNINMCGFRQMDGYDPVKEYWASRMKEMGQTMQPNIDFENTDF